MPDYDDDLEHGERFAISPDAMIWLVCAMVLSSVFFGALLLTVLTIPGLHTDLMRTIPAVIFASLILAPASAGFVAYRMRLRNWGRRAWVRGDVISGHRRR